MMSDPSIIYSSSGTYLLSLEQTGGSSLCTASQFTEYTVVIVLKGSGVFHADFGSFPFTAPVLLFATPIQLIYLENCNQLKYNILKFHGDFYCIEYHRKEVSCNGLLFNNIYIDPVVHLTAKEADGFQSLLADLTAEANQQSPSEIVLRSYLQLFLAKSSNIKLKAIDNLDDKIQIDEQMQRFTRLLDQHYLDLHKPSDYAGLLAMSTDNFRRRSVHYFSKTPSQLIQERLVLEAKKELHLTRKSIKEIAYHLKFKDEFYFSRFFKKVTKVSPQSFRDKTGISIIADLSKP
ncbi:AraC family transcriptional activator of pobA [Mucilaginibacter sp. UYP25]|uniref:helix-turn-helix domain-containing protein n=1 Tax=unclassified Mucilaginibacter TaxID=2617802 RepID=UPI00339B5BFB